MFFGGNAMRLPRRKFLHLAASAIALPTMTTSDLALAQPTTSRAKGPLVWLDMDQKELDDAYDNSVYAPNREIVLKRCARNRSGHAILVLSAFLLPEPRLAYLARMFWAGALIMYIDDHGDCWSDLAANRLTFMNQVCRPELALRRLFQTHIRQLASGLPQGDGRDLLIAFLTRYYLTRIEKHRQQRTKGGSPWAVYE